MLDRAKNQGTPRPYLRNVNVRWFSFDLSDLIEMRFLDEEAAKFTAVKGDVLICEGGYPGRAAIWEEDYPIHFQKAVHRVRFHECERNKWFLYYLYYLESTGALQKYFTGTGIQHFTGQALKQLPIALPPLAEQQRVVGILDEAFAGIVTAKANAEKNLRNARELFASYLEDIFTRGEDGWSERKLEDVVHSKCTLSYGIVQPGMERADGLPIVRPTDLTTKTVRLAGLKRIDPALASAYKRTTLVGDELLLCVRGTTGVVAVATRKLQGGNVTRGIVPIRFDSSVIQQEFGYYLFLSGATQKQIKAGTYGAALMQINIRDLRNLVVRFPSLGEQRKLVVKFDELAANTQRLESLYQQKHAALDALKKSLLHQAFSGQLTAGGAVTIPTPAAAFPATISNITTTKLHAGILAMACQLHEKHGKQAIFTHVKGEKIAHMVEARLGINLGRNPVKDAAGPNDFQHLIKVEHHARKANYFDFKQVNGGAYRVQKLNGFDRLIEKARNALGDRVGEVDGLLQWMLHMNVQQAEIVATVFAGWNNLLLDGKSPTDEEIVFESCENWHPQKSKIERRRFFAAVEWLRKEGIVPSGRGKKVIPKPKKR